jgi:uncharacterized protein (TIGR02391 family)
MTMPLSDTPLQQLPRRALEHFGHVISGVYKGSEITELFARAGFSDIRHDGSSKAWFVAQALQALQDGVASPLPVLRVLECLCDPDEYLGRDAIRTGILDDVNQILIRFGLQVDEPTGTVRLAGDGEPVDTTPADDLAAQRSFNARRFHPAIVRHGRRFFAQGHYQTAVFECCKAFERAVEAKSGLAGQYGRALMASAFHPATGPLMINGGSTTSARDEREGFHLIAMGVAMAIRNPAGHEVAEHATLTADEALELLGIISYLLRRLDDAARRGH